MEKKIRICFIADKHSLFDDRIYWKMAVPLKKRGYDVYYLLIDTQSQKGITEEGITYEILKLKTFSKNRYFNFIIKNLDPSNNYKKLFKKAKDINADIYHFHDLWINKIGKKLKNLSHKPVVIYDAREPYAEDYISLYKANGIIKYGIKLFAFLVNRWEKAMATNYDLVIANEHIVRNNFRRKLGVEKAITIFNYTDIYKNYQNLPETERLYDFIYCGGITESRGALKIVEAVKISKSNLPEIKMVFVGRYSPVSLKNKIQKYIEDYDLENNIQLISFVEYEEVIQFYNKSKVGLVPWLPLKSLEIKMPIKVFEYMAFGLPVIGSNFGHIKEYIEKDNCGITVDPSDPVAISKAMIELMTNSEKYDRYSKNGRAATLNKYKWEFEFERLLEYYTKFLNKRENIRNGIT